MKREFKMKIGCLLLAVFFFFCGCARLNKKTDTLSPSEQMYSESQVPASSYMDFGDILIPHGLKVVPKETFVIRSSGLTTGVLVLKGRVERASLINFFEVNMIKDNWQLISSFKLPRTLMLYNKDSRWCIVSVFEGRISTKVEIWVSPKKDAPASGLLN